MSDYPPVMSMTLSIHHLIKPCHANETNPYQKKPCNVSDAIYSPPNEILPCQQD